MLPFDCPDVIAILPLRVIQLAARLEKLRFLNEGVLPPLGPVRKRSVLIIEILVYCSRKYQHVPGREGSPPFYEVNTEQNGNSCEHTVEESSITLGGKALEFVAAKTRLIIFPNVNTRCQSAVEQPRSNPPWVRRITCNEFLINHPWHSLQASFLKVQSRGARERIPTRSEAHQSEIFLIGQGS